MKQHALDDIQLQELAANLLSVPANEIADACAKNKANALLDYIKNCQIVLQEYKNRADGL